MTVFWSPSMVPIIAPQHSSGYAAWAWLTISRQGVRSIRSMFLTMFYSDGPLLLGWLGGFVPEMLAQVFIRAVTENRNNYGLPALAMKFAPDRESGMDVAAGRYADERAFLPCEPLHHAMRVFGLDP